MRLWLVDPRIMCRQHLLGEHVECHAFVGTINKGVRVKGYLRDNLLQINMLAIRHEELAEEMKSRGYNHKSPLPELQIRYNDPTEIDRKRSLEELLRRCPRCRERYENANENEKQEGSEESTVTEANGF